MKRYFIAIAAITGAIAVILGAFAVHGLKTMLPVEKLSSFNTATKYQLMHAVVLLVIAIFLHNKKAPLLEKAYLIMLIGIIFFSGSIYLLSLKTFIGLSSYKWLIPITPIGGFLVICGWVMIAIWGIKENISKS